MEEYHVIFVTEDNFIETSEFLFATLARTRGEPGAIRLKEDGLTLAELRTELKSQLNSTSYDPKKILPPCDCTHPPSMGKCFLGMCISAFRNGISITINI